MPDARPPLRQPKTADSEQAPIEHEGERLQKVLAAHGLGSRRACEELIADGRVSVNGTIAPLGRRVELGRDHIAIDGVPLRITPGLVYYLLHKPAGVVSTSSDTHGRPTVVELVPAEPRVFSVGRLDLDTEGLLILTNDGDLAHQLTHPSFHVEKEYLAHVQGEVTKGQLRTLRDGVELEDGRTAPAGVSQLSPGLLRIVIHEGRNRQVRRMCAAVGHPVLRLVRVRIGPLADRALKPGEWRPLSHEELTQLEASKTAAADAGDERTSASAEPTSLATTPGPDDDLE